jgi:hypothetical protein
VGSVRVAAGEGIATLVAKLVVKHRQRQSRLFGARATGIGGTYCSIRTVVTCDLYMCAQGRQRPRITSDNENDGADTQTSLILHPDPGYSLAFNVQLY